MLSFAMLYVPTALGFQYDEGRLKGALVLLGYIVGSVFRWVYLLLFTLSGGRAFPGMRLLSICIGLAAYAIADEALSAWRRSRGGKGPSDVASP